MVDLLVPIAKRVPGTYHYTTLLPQEMIGKVVGLQNRSTINDLSQIFHGRGDRPRETVVLVASDGRTPILIAGLGEAEVAELEETALALMESTDRQLKATGQAFPFEELRARRGLGDFNTFEQRYRQACNDYVDRHGRNFRSDPAPGHDFFPSKAPSIVTVPEKPWQKEDRDG